ncbi:MAG: DNA-processing protein DprA [Cyanobacteria bacterium P01_C01_bin.89]
MPDSEMPDSEMLSDRQERAAWVAWSQVKGMGPVSLRRVHDAFGSMAVAWAAPEAELGQVEGIGKKTLGAIATARTINPQKTLAAYEQKNPQFWTPADPDYPALLKEIPDPPPILHYRGDPSLIPLDGTFPLIAVVGTRHPSDYGTRWTRRIVDTLARRGLGIVSGLAEGIDTEAHQTTLAANGKTLAVVGTGLNVVYPSKNKPLYRTLVGDRQTNQPALGLALSEYPAGTRPNASHFPQRNRIVAALCRATLVMEGGYKSGALITARAAAEYGRDVYVLPGSLDNPQAMGCLRLIDCGAQVILSIDDLLEKLSRTPELDKLPLDLSASKVATQKSTSKAEPKSSNLPISQPASAPILESEPVQISEHLRPIYDAIATEPTLYDHIVEKSQIPPQKISAGLIELELLGAIVQLPGMMYKKV